LLVKYCDDDCQRQDWKKHKPHCITKEEQARRKGLSEELWLDSCRGDVRAMNALAAQGADINYAWLEKRVLTPLTAAVCGAEFAMIDALIVAGVRVNAVMADGNSALCYACIFGDQDLARQAGMTCDSTSLRMVNALIAAGANVNQVTSKGASPLTPACEHDHPSVVDALIKAGANVNHTRPDGATALGMASQKGFAETVRVLLAAGADPRLSDTHGHSALIAAKHNNHTAVVALLEARLAELTGSV
jgi:ankyrin repeat protein